MFRKTFGNVATPLTALTVKPPSNTAPVGFEPSASVTLAEDDVTTLPDASSIATWIAGVTACVATALVGCTSKTTCVGAGGAVPL